MLSIQRQDSRVLSLACVALIAMCFTARGDDPIVVRLWPESAPGESKTLPAEGDTSKPNDNQVAGKSVIRLGNVSQPTMTIYRPKPEIDTGAAVLVCPGGGYYILALDLEGTEVCEWLNSIGVTAALLKYRVPRRDGKEPHELPLQDAQRAMNLLRSNSKSYGIDPNRIGCLGFSAGANLCTQLSTQFAKSTYPTIEEKVDSIQPKPNFTFLIYPGYMVSKDDKTKLAENITFSADMSPVFLSMAQDDPLGCENVLVPAVELSKLKVPVSLHLYPKGGHGYGMRKTGNPALEWPDRAAEWMKSLGVLNRSN